MFENKFLQLLEKVGGLSCLLWLKYVFHLLTQNWYILTIKTNL